MKILNSVSLNMLSEGSLGFRIVGRLSEIASDIGYDQSGMDAVHWAFAKSYIGHQDLCNVLYWKYGITIACNRATVELTTGEKVLVVQYRGPRLPEGSKVLPHSAIIEFLIVEVL